MLKNIKKMIATTLAVTGVVGVGMCIGNTITHASECDAESEIKEQQEQTLFPSEELQADDDNLYVDLNNELVNAINDYTNGKISEDEYKQICKQISKKIDSEAEFSELKEQEEEFQEKVNEEK